MTTDRGHCAKMTFILNRQARLPGDDRDIQTEREREREISSSQEKDLYNYNIVNI